MEDRKIREKYGGKLPKAINRAIRAEVPGGNEALEKLTQLAGAARNSGWKDHAGRSTDEAKAYFRHKEDVVDRMSAEVRKRWGLPPEESREELPKKAPRAPRTTSKPRGASRQPAVRGRPPRPAFDSSKRVAKSAKMPRAPRREK